MESLENCELILDIEMIESITGPIPHFEILFVDSKEKKYKLIFNSVWDMRYSIENANISRFIEFRKRLPVGIIDNGIYVVKDSKYIKYFNYQAGGTRPIDELTHYAVSDRYDIHIDLLVDMHKPVLVPLE